VRIKTKICIFIALVFIILIVGIFAGWKFASIGGGIIGAVAAICSGKSIRDDGRGNNSGIDGELGKARKVDRAEGDLNSDERDRLDREREILDGEKRSLGLEKSDTQRERELLEELQKRHPEK
jgi:hypothetical protein